MTPKSYEKRNYVFLYRGLSITRDALLDFVVNRLKNTYGERWWEEGVTPAFRPEDIESLKNQFTKRFSNPAGPTRPGTELYEILDINYIVMVVENKKNWKSAFADILNNDRTLLSYIREIILFRNPVAHPETGDLKDDDAFRGLDTCERLLRLIDKAAGDEISKIKNEIRSAWLHEEIGLGSVTPDQIGVSIDVGFQRLEEAIRTKRETGSEQYQEFVQLKNFVLEGINLIRKGGGEPNIKKSNQKSFEAIDRLSQEYLDTSFSNACVIFSPLPKFTPEEASKKTLAIRRELEKLEKEIKELEIDKEFQNNLGTAGSGFFQNRIDDKSKLLEAKREEYEKIRNEVSAPVFFSVIRETDTTIQEENPFTVVVRIKNLGRNSTRVQYEEGLGEGIKLLNGKTTFDEEIGPDASYEFSYMCYCETTGKHSLFTNKLDYVEKIRGWDVLSDTKIISRAGTAPILQGERYYQHNPLGTEFIVRIKNVGDKIAHGVTFEATIPALGEETVNLSLQTDINPDEIRTVSCMSNLTDLKNIVLPETTSVSYSDNRSRRYSLELGVPFSLLEYTFPTNIRCVGRDEEITIVENVLQQLSGSITNGLSNLGKKIILVEGSGGIGKSKFVDEIKANAERKYNYKVFIEDASNKAPVLRTLRQVLELNTDLVTKQDVWGKLNVIAENRDFFVQRDILARFLVSNFEQFSQSELARLKTDILLLLGKVCQKKSILLIFENIHEIPIGNELEIFKAILDFTTTKGDLKLVVCATYRPQEDLPAKILGETGDLACINLELHPFSKQDALHFINLIIPFPLLNEELTGLVFSISGGSPLFMRELLRQLTLSTNNYVVRKGNYWYATPNFRREELTIELSQLILQRAKRDAKDRFRLLQVLSIVGLDFSWKLLSGFFEGHKLLSLNDDELLVSLDALEHLGFIKKKSNNAISDLEFSFEHQVIRDAIYDEIRSSDDIKLTTLHTSVRDRLVTIIIKNNHNGQLIFADTEEHFRQTARHLLHSSSEQQFVNRTFLFNAGRIESARRNFLKAQDYMACFLRCCSGRTNYFEQAQISYESAKIHKMQGHWVRAKEDLDNSLNLLEQATSTKSEKREKNSLKIKILAEQGYIFVNTKDYLEANDYLYRARKRIEGPLGYRRIFPPKEKVFFQDLVEIYINLAEISYLKLDTMIEDISAICFHRAEALSKKYQREFGDESLLINVLVQEGEIYSLKEEKDRAIQKLQDAIHAMEKKPDESKDKYSLERALSYMAEIQRDRGERVAAKIYYEQARKIQEDLQDFYGLGISFGGIGDLYVEDGNLESSEFYLEKAFQYQQMVGDTERFWRTCFSLSKVNLKSNRHDQAGYYWYLSRKFVIEKFKDLRPQKKSDVFSHIQALTKYYYDAKLWEKALILCLDLRLLTTEDSQFVRVTEMLGSIYSELKDTENAVSTLNEELDYATNDLNRADIYCSLGDICSASKDAHLKSLAEDHYKAGVKLFLNNKLSAEAVSTFNKYLQNITSESDALRISPVLFDIIEMMSNKQMGINSRLIEQSEKKLEKFKLFKQMGDILVFSVHRMAQKNDGSNLERELGFLQKAESHYQSCRAVLDVIGGYHKLISVYFHLNLWDKIADCYQSILGIIRKVNDIEIFKETVNEIILLEDKFDLTVFKTVVRSVNRERKKLDLTLYQGLEFELTLNLAKCFFSIAQKSTDEEKSTYQNLALEHYDQVISMSGNPGLIQVGYHDSAIILCYLEQKKEAERRLSESIKISRDGNNFIGEAHSRIVLAGLQVEKGDHINAEHEYQKSIRILQRVCESWDERVKNQDREPLSPKEVAHLRYDKGWLANASDDYGSFLFRSNPMDGIAWLRRALEIYKQIGDSRATEQLSQKIEYAEKMLSQKTDRFIPATINASEFVTPYYQESMSYKKCASCSYIYQRDKKKCPKCGKKTCPHCGTHVPDREEFCLECDAYVG